METGSGIRIVSPPALPARYAEGPSCLAGQKSCLPTLPLRSFIFSSFRPFWCLAHISTLLPLVSSPCLFSEHPPPRPLTLTHTLPLQSQISSSAN